MQIQFTVFILCWDILDYISIWEWFIGGAGCQIIRVRWRLLSKWNDTFGATTDSREQYSGEITSHAKWLCKTNENSWNLLQKEIEWFTNEYYGAKSSNGSECEFLFLLLFFLGAKFIVIFFGSQAQKQLPTSDEVNKSREDESARSTLKELVAQIHQLQQEVREREMLTKRNEISFTFKVSRENQIAIGSQVKR